MVSEDLFLSGSYDKKSPRKLSVGGLSFPKNKLSSAFGQTVFSSNWMQNENSVATELGNAGGMAMNDESEDMSAVAKTIEHLGLDEPLSSSQLRTFVPVSKTRPRSLSFPHDFNLEHSRMLFGRTNRSTTDCACNLSEDGSYEIYDTTASFKARSTTPSAKPKDLEHSVENPLHEAIGPSRSLWLGNLDASVGIEELTTIFSQFGTIESVRVLPEKECAFVNYTRVEDAVLGRERMQGGRIGSCVIRIGFGKPESIYDSQGMTPTKSLCNM